MSWVEDKAWSDVFLREIKQILGEHLIDEAPEEEDQKRNTDLIVMKMGPLRVACRVRRPEFLGRYPDEFTIRCTRPSGSKTEFQKIVEGWGDYFLYGFSDRAEKRLARWTLADLSLFRREMVSRLWNGVKPAKMVNADNSSEFFYFNWASFSRDMIVAKSWPEQMEMFI